MVIEHIVSPAPDQRADEMLADIEIDRNDRIIGEQHALGLLEIQASATGVELLACPAHQGVEFLARIARHVRRIVAFHDVEERVRIVVIADPAGAEHLRYRGITHIGKQNLELFIDQRCLDPERLPPHRFDGERYPLLGVRRVIAQFDAGRVIGAEAGLGIEPSRKQQPLVRRQGGESEMDRLVIVDAGWHPAVSRRFPSAENFIDDDLSVDRHRQCLSQLRVILKRRLRQVVAVIINREVGSDSKLIASLGANRCETVGRYVCRDVQFAGAIPVQLGDFLWHHVVVDDVDRCRSVIPVMRIALQAQDRTRLPCLERVSPVG